MTPRIFSEHSVHCSGVRPGLSGLTGFDTGVRAAESFDSEELELEDEDDDEAIDLR